jgi:circadian clock protein KaiB
MTDFSDEPRVYRLKLYTMSLTSDTQRIVDHLHSLEGEMNGLTLDLEVIELKGRIDLAEQARILTTPTLIRESPLPVRRLVGNLEHRERLAKELDLFNNDAAHDSP